MSASLPSRATRPDPGTHDAMPPPEAGAHAPHFVHVFPSFAIGGVPIRIATILNHLGRQYRHTIVALDGVFDCRTRLDPALETRLIALPIRKDQKLETLLLFRRTLRQFRPDLLLTYNWGAIEWALTNTLLRYCPHIHFESGFGREEADRQVMRRVLFRRVALSGASRIVVPSMTLMDLATGTWKLPADKLLYIPNGVDCERFGRRPDPAALPGFARAPGDFVVGTVAPLRPEKNLGRLLRVFAKLPTESRPRLVVVGDGPERGALARQADALGVADRVVFAGHVEAPERVLGWFDVFAISSDTEQMPNTVLQAMAAGRPIAGVDVGDIKAMVTPENRELIVPKTDEEAFAGTLLALAASPARREALGSGNQAHVRAQYDQAKMFAAYRALFAATTTA